MHSIRQSSQAALRSSGNACTYINGSRRAFSRTCTRSGRALPVFLEPSTPELSSLLSALNSKVLLPYFLSKEQEKLVYKQANKAKLEAEPVEITLGDVTVPLEHLNRSHLPNRWETYSKIVRSSETRDDGENAIRMLEGFHNAGIKIKPGWQNILIRHLNDRDMHQLVLKALQRVKATGLSLKNFEILLNVLRGVHDKAAMADWDEGETQKAFKMARQIVEMLEEPEHHGEPGRGELVSDQDHRGNPLVIAVPTELAAVLAEQHGGDVEEVKRFANRLLSALKHNTFSNTLTTIKAKSQKSDADLQNGAKQAAACIDLRDDLFQLLVIWNALKTSRNVLGKDMPTVPGTEDIEAQTLKVLKEGMAGLEKLQIRNGKELVQGAVKSVKEQFAKFGGAKA